MRRVLLASTVALAIGVLGLAPAGASAESLCTDTWTGPAEGLWTIAEDWSTGKVPTATDVACIGSGKTVKVTEGTNQTGVVQGEGTLVISGGSLEAANALEVSKIKALTVSEGTLTGAGTVEVAGSFSGGKNGHLNGTGTTVIRSGASGSVINESFLNLAKRTLINEGSLTIPLEAGIAGKEGAAIVNHGTLTINGQGESKGLFVEGPGPTPTLTNTATVQKTEGTGTTPIRFTVDNESTITTTSGTLELAGGGTSGKEKAGSWSASGAGTGILFREGTYVLGSTVPLSGAFTVTNSGFSSHATVTAGRIEGSSASMALVSNSFGTGGVLEVSGPSPSTLSTLSVSDSTLTGAGEVDVSTSFSAENSAQLNGTGTTVIKPSASGSIASGSFLYMAKHTLVNEGSLTIPLTSAIAGNEGATIVNHGTFTINGEGEAKGLFTETPGPTPTVINTGTVQKTEGTGTTPIRFGFENLGAVVENTGKFEFTNPIITDHSTQYGGSNPSAPGHPCPVCGDPVTVATGNFSETQTDLSVGGRGVGLNLTRYYNSQAAAAGNTGIFGPGWSTSFSDHLVVEKASKTATLVQGNASTVVFTEAEGGSFVAPGWTQDTLTGSSEAGYTLTLASQVKYKFAGANGRLESVTDRNGNATTLAYEGGGRLETITDPTARKITLAYNGEGFVESAKDPMGHVVKYVYEGGNLKSVTQPAEVGLRWQFKYDGSHQITEMVDGRGGKTTNEYNGSHQVTLQKDPAGRELGFEYETFRTKVTNKTTGSVTDERFTSNDEPSSITRGFGTASATTESLAYNAAGLPVGLTDGNGHTTTYEYDGSSNRTKMVDANKNETKWTYNATHDVETMTTPKGETTTIKRDAHGNPEVIERPAPASKTQTTKYKYLATGELESVEDPLKRVSKYEYDSHGNRVSETDPLSEKRTWEYNEDSQEISTVSPRGNVTGGKPAEFTTKIERDSQGRPLTITDPLGHTTKYTYDGDGNVETMVDGNSHKTTYTYNADNQPVKVEAPNKAITETEYDGAGQVISQTDGNKNITKYKRNVVEEVTEATDPLGRKTTKEYYAAGNLKTLTDPAKRTTTYTYDPADRLTEVSYSDGVTPTVKDEYDADGDRTKMSDGTGTTKYTYDQLDRLTEYENGHKEVSKYEYDLANQKTKITYPNTKSVTRAFDKAGRLEKVTDWSSNVTKFTYNADSYQITTLFPTGTKGEDKYGYNNADKMSESKMVKLLEPGSETLASLSYIRDNDGQVKKTTSVGMPGAEITENTYDVNNRLTKSGSEYKYDAADNATTIGAGTYKYDKDSELETGPSLTYTYDEVGQRVKTKPTSGPVTTYGYDQAGNLKSVERPKEGEIAEIKDTYAYDGNGLRASQTISGTTTYLSWDATQALPLILSDGTSSYVYGPNDLPIAQINNTSGAILYLHHDQAGSTRMLTSSTGVKEASFTYDAYGNTTGTTGTAKTPLGYDAQYTSQDTGLIYLRARVYDPATAQLMSTDPAGPVTRAPYFYTNDNPLNLGDPSGLSVIGTLEGVAEGALKGGIDVVAVGPYALYYGSHELARGINALGKEFGLPGEVIAHLDSLSLVQLQALGLAGDVAIDAVKNQLFGHESICDEGTVGYINPLHGFLPGPLKGPQVELPGIEPNGHIDIEL